MGGERSLSARIRAQQAAHRIMQLRERASRLYSPPGLPDAASAAEALSQAIANTEQARQRATTAYRRAAEAHREAALAMHALGDLDRAAWHRDRAADDDLAAEAQQLRDQAPGDARVIGVGRAEPVNH